jgi:SAM-dependent methyltransferase
LFDAREALRGHRIARVLDFGGDRGELTRAAFPEAEHFVYDISGVKPAEGVRALHSMEECATVEFDLILTSNVLEHVGSPLAITRQIAQVARPGTLLFHEVPLENPASCRARLRRLAMLLIRLAVAPSKGVRLLRRGVLTAMQEHVNYFRPQPLHYLLECSGVRVMETGCYCPDDRSRTMNVWVLAKK